MRPYSTFSPTVMKIILSIMSIIKKNAPIFDFSIYSYYRLRNQRIFLLFRAPLLGQILGGNVLSTLTNLLKSPYLEHPADFGDRRFVFYDVIGLFNVVYPLDVGEIINYIVVAIIAAKVVCNVSGIGCKGNNDMLPFNVVQLIDTVCARYFDRAVFQAHSVSFMDARPCRWRFIKECILSE